MADKIYHKRRGPMKVKVLEDGEEFTKVQVFSAKTDKRIQNDLKESKVVERTFRTSDLLTAHEYLAHITKRPGAAAPHPIVVPPVIGPAPWVVPVLSFFGGLLGASLPFVLTYF